jgi:hypothetical protein
MEQKRNRKTNFEEKSRGHRVVNRTALATVRGIYGWWLPGQLVELGPEVKRGA